MDPIPHPAGALDGEFQLAAWLVQPDLNRLSCSGKTVQIEPKIMAVLVCLAERACEVVSKEEIIAAVWPQQFVTDSVITRSIGLLRRALEDDASNPSYIETISKRGYRLLVEAANGPSSGVPLQALTVVRDPEALDKTDHRMRQERQGAVLEENISLEERRPPIENKPRRDSDIRTVVAVETIGART